VLHDFANPDDEGLLSDTGRLPSLVFFFFFRKRGQARSSIFPPVFSVSFLLIFSFRGVLFSEAGYSAPAVTAQSG